MIAGMSSLPDAPGPRPGRRAGRAELPTPEAPGIDPRILAIGAGLFVALVALVGVTFWHLTRDAEPPAVRLTSGTLVTPVPAPVPRDPPRRDPPAPDPPVPAPIDDPDGELVVPVPVAPALELGRFEIEHAKRIAAGELATAADALDQAREELTDPASVARLDALARTLAAAAQSQLALAIAATEGLVAAGDLDRAAAAIQAARARLAFALGDLEPFLVLERKVEDARAAALAAKGVGELAAAAVAHERAGDFARSMRAWEAVARSPGATDAQRTAALGEVARLEVAALVAGALSDAERDRLGAELPALVDAVRRWLDQGDLGVRDRIVAMRPAPALLEALLTRARRYADAPGAQVVELDLVHERFKDKAFVAVPSDYDPRVAYPLVVFLHGTSASVGMCRQYAEFMLGAAEGRYLALVPHTQPPQTGVGWGPTRYGIDPAFTAIDACMKRFHVDPDRVGLTGQSMGGHATWDIPMQHPDRFCALAPKASAAYHTWQKGMFANLKHVPMRVLHGALDDVVPVKLTRESVASARAAGVTVDYRESPSNGHEAASWTEIAKAYAWLAEQRRVRHPASLRYRVRHPHRARGGWVSIDRFAPKAKQAFVRYVTSETRELLERTATFVDPDPPGIDATATTRSRIDLLPTNVEAVTLFLHPELVEFSRELTIACKGRVLRRLEPRAELGTMLDSARESPWRPIPWMKVAVSLE